MIQITWLGHATFELQFPGGEVLLFDPFTEDNPTYPKDHKIQKVDAIALSHAHFDHSTGVLPLAKKFAPKLIAIFETASYYEKKGAKNTIGMNKGGTVDLGFARLTMTHALHSNCIKDGNELLYAGDPAGFVLRTPEGKSLYFAGDTALFSDMKLIGELYKPELALLPIGDHFTMGPDQAAYAAKFLGCRRVIPMHYGTFPALTGTPAELAQLLKPEGIEVWTLELGKSVQW